MDNRDVPGDDTASVIPMGEFSDLLARLDPDPRVRGKQFERICKWFLTNDPVYKHELRRVWLWDEWPGRWGGDAGIDLVAEDRTGNLWAIQAKAYDPAYRVTKRDVNKFLAESGREVFTYRMLIATTNLIDRIGERTIQDQEKRVSFFRLNDLQAADVDWPASPTALRATPPRKPARPHDYQREAIKQVIKGFASADRGQLIMACGTGKTLTALFIREKLAAERTLVLVPSLSLLKQTLNVWRANCTAEFVSLPVCSDDTVARDDDVALEHTSDLGVPVTTDPAEIAAFLRRRSGPQSGVCHLPVLAADRQSVHVGTGAGVRPGRRRRGASLCGTGFVGLRHGPRPDGDKGQAAAVHDGDPALLHGPRAESSPGGRLRVRLDGRRSQVRHVFHRLGFGEAIKRDLLTDYQVAIVGVDDATYREWARDGVLRDPGRGEGHRRRLPWRGRSGWRKPCGNTTCTESSRSTHGSSGRGSSPTPCRTCWRGCPPGSARRVNCGPATPRVRCPPVTGTSCSSTSDTSTTATGVSSPTPAVWRRASTCRPWTAVAFIDPRRSEVDIVQAVGRAIRKSEDKTVGTIVIPVFIDTDAIPKPRSDGSAFKPVWDVIKALRAHDEELG